MPHINRIRVNNVKYNFGTQFYDDFVMKPFCSNTLYDLANGGGKSVLMLLLLQNVIPNCTLDEKQPIEKLFRTGEGSTTIHSLIEWRLNENDVKNDFKYMTTGFCARKASTGEGENQTTQAIEYFNYCVFYREYNENDIRNLPLVKDGQRITYSGLKKHLKELERDPNLIVKVFERKGEYQRFISEYGLYESEWEIVRGINKTEGHVRTYFETNYKTTRKVVEDLLIEEIIQKAFLNRTNQSEEEELMAGTLLNIKDKLLDLSKKKSQINNYDNQMEIIESFAGRLNTLNDVFLEKKKVGDEINKVFHTTHFLSENYTNKLEVLKETNSSIKNDLRTMERQVETAKVQLFKQDLLKLTKDIDILEKDIQGLKEKEEKHKELLDQKEAMNYYLEYLLDKKNRDEIKEAIASNSGNKDSLLKELNALAYAKYQIIKKKKQEFLDKEEELNKVISEDEKALEDCVKKEHILDKELAIERNNQWILEGKVEELSEKIQVLRKQVSILFLEKIDDGITENALLIKKVKNEVDATREKMVSLLDQKENYRIRLSECRYSLDAILIEEEKLKKQLEYKKKENEKLDTLLNIYEVNRGEKLGDAIWSKYAKLRENKDTLKKQLEGLVDRRNRLKAKDVLSNRNKIDELKEFIVERFDDKSFVGMDYIKDLSQEEKERILEQIPFLPYSIIVTIPMIELVTNFNYIEKEFSETLIPILHVSVLESLDSSVDVNKCYFVGKRKNLILDENEQIKEEQFLESQIKIFEKEIATNMEQERILRKDLQTVSIALDQERDSYAVIEQKIDTILSDKKNIRIENDDILLKLSSLDMEEKEQREQINSLENNLTEIKKEEGVLLELKELSKKLKLSQDKLLEHSEKQIAMEEELKLLQTKNDSVSMNLKEEVNALSQIKKIFEKIEDHWKQNYSKYYVEETYAISSLTEEEIDASFGGKRIAFEKEFSDFDDKKRLIDSYVNSMNKSLRSISNRGVSLAFLEEKKERNEIVEATEQELNELHALLKQFERKIHENENLVQKKTADKNKLSGRISQGKSMVEEKYGYYEELVNVQNLETFIYETTNALGIQKEKTKEVLTEMDFLESEIRFLEDMSKDILRLIKDYNINISKEVTLMEDSKNIKTLFMDLSSRGDKVIKEEKKRVEELLRQKEKTVETLKLLGAYELSEEMRISVVAPNSYDEAVLLSEKLMDTKQCIALEKSRIHKGIEDMEKMKDNFENQCLQRCSNVRTELDRLKKLSKITLDGESIPIINLTIPYKKDEFLKNEMSNYIDEIVMGVDSYENNNDRLKYIRNALALKKLFSVIVTDMNSIKLTLYKRERMKEQSRHLRYEEAVGSTGQSQGIYIQFLIAIINYITNINSVNKDNSGLRKVIFIDNPFGAAKDVYIWEPIFELLKVNRVQLIVPARGTTPAITGRFDVNYILGQKIVNGKQQTVVVNYRSQIDTKEVEYLPLQYEQESFGFLSE